jgi:mannose-1-phosphate guanylyltransferase
MRALLLAAGLGTRLRQLSTIIPKCLLPINGRPLLEYWLKYLSETGVAPALVNLHYLPNVVEEYLIQSPFASQVSTVYEETLLGTGGTLLHNREFFREEPIMLIHADNICFCNFREFIRSHHERPAGTEITMMTFTTPTPQTCGIIELDARGVVKAFHEKVENPPGNLANAAVYIVQPSVFEFLASLEKPVIDFSTEVLPHYLGRIYTYHNTVYHRDIGNIKSLMKAQIEFPQAAVIPQGRDSWNSYCGADNLSRAQNIMLAFSKNCFYCFTRYRQGFLHEKYLKLWELSALLFVPAG